MKCPLQAAICRFTGAESATRVSRLQQLWSGYGEIARYQLEGASITGVVVKQIQLPSEVSHPRGWHSDIGHQRKVHSYGVEAHWYQHYADSCPSPCRVAQCYGYVDEAGVQALVLEDLDASGFATRLSKVNGAAMRCSIRWLANFHAQWMANAGEGLWSTGNYWHLQTRPDELAAMADGPLKQNATALDRALHNARYRTLLHGDAKVANFCYSADHHTVAAVDFQYVGRGAGVVDLVYLLGSCFSGAELHQQAERWLGFYLQQLADAMLQIGRFEQKQVAEIQAEWRFLYSIAWADFERFLQGWSPEHAKLSSYSAAQTELALSALSS